MIEGCFAVLDPTSDNLGERVNVTPSPVVPSLRTHIPACLVGSIRTKYTQQIQQREITRLYDAYANASTLHSVRLALFSSETANPLMLLVPRSSSVYSSILDSDMTARYYCGIIRDLEPAAADLNAFRGGKQTAQVPLDESSPQISPVKTPPPKKYLSVRFHIMAGVPLSREVQKLSEDAICLSWSPGMTWEEFFGQNQTVAQGIDQ